MSAAQPCGRQTGPLTPARQFDWDINDTSVPRVCATAIIISTVQLIKKRPRALLTRGILMNRKDVRERCLENKGSRRVRSEATREARGNTHVAHFSRALSGKGYKKFSMTMPHTSNSSHKLYASYSGHILKTALVF
jgi:hypothetical protein